MSGRREFEALADDYRRQGWEITRRGKHQRWVAPWGQVFFACSTPSDHRAIKNFKAILKRACPSR